MPGHQLAGAERVCWERGGRFGETSGVGKSKAVWGWFWEVLGGPGVFSEYFLRWVFRFGFISKQGGRTQRMGKRSHS